MNVTDRRSLAGGTAPLPATSELFITRREEEHNTSPAANVFLFNKSFDPSIPHQVEVNRQYQPPHSAATQDQLSGDRRLSHPPSKIPINEGYLEHNNSIKNERERVNENGISESQPKEKVVMVCEFSKFIRVQLFSVYLSFSIDVFSQLMNVIILSIIVRIMIMESRTEFEN